jgi:Carboxypeptidase regulatory-like domain
MKNNTLIAVLLLLIGFPRASAATPQVTTATIVGTITDSSGAALPGATVTARNVDTGFNRTVPSNEDGAYRLEFLPIGRYVVEVSLSGFKTATRSGIVLSVNDTARVDASLSVGGVTETVNVEGASPNVNTTTSEISKTIDAVAIQSLPIVDRNVYSLLDLTPGVQSNNNGIASASSGTNSLILGFPEQRTLINGGADGGTGSVNYYLDGGINMTGLRNTGNILPNPDAIQEFKVQTNSYNAEYGRFASGVINVITKAGTNAYRGSAFEYLRDGHMNANEWGSVLDTPPLKRNQYGGTAGGPITRDRTFFFGSYSGLRQKTSTFLNTAIVPTAQERTGDFSASRTLPTDPATGQTFVCNGVVGLICPNRLDPVAMKIINNYIPLSNVPGQIWQGYVPSPYDSDEMLVKIDHQLNAAHRLTGSYFLTSGSNTVRAGGGNLPWANQQFKWTQHNVNVSDTWVVSTNKINQSWFSFNRNFGGRLQLPATSLTDLGSSAVIQGTPSLPQITVSGFFTLSNAIGGPTAGGDFYSARDLFSWTRVRTRSSSVARSRTTRPFRTRCSTTTASSRSTTA